MIRALLFSGHLTSTASKRPSPRRAFPRASELALVSALHLRRFLTLFRRFDGSMSQQKREDLIKSFSAPVKTNKKLKKGEKPPPTVMLISLKVSYTSLHPPPSLGADPLSSLGRCSRTQPDVRLSSVLDGSLVAGVSLSPQLCLHSPLMTLLSRSIEAQAIDRVYRIGQTRS